MSASFITEDYLRALGGRDFYILYHETLVNYNTPSAPQVRSERKTRLALMRQIAKDRSIDLEATEAPLA